MDVLSSQNYLVSFKLKDTGSANNKDSAAWNEKQVEDISESFINKTIIINEKPVNGLIRNAFQRLVDRIACHVVYDLKVSVRNDSGYKVGDAEEEGAEAFLTVEKGSKEKNEKNKKVIEKFCNEALEKYCLEMEKLLSSSSVNHEDMQLFVNKLLGEIFKKLNEYQGGSFVKLDSSIHDGLVELFETELLDKMVLRNPPKAVGGFVSDFRELGAKLLCVQASGFFGFVSDAVLGTNYLEGNR